MIDSQKTKIMIDALDLAEMLANVRKYGREGIYMETEACKVCHESIGLKVEDE